MLLDSPDVSNVISIVIQILSKKREIDQTINQFPQCARVAAIYTNFCSLLPTIILLIITSGRQDESNDITEQGVIRRLEVSGTRRRLLLAIDWDPTALHLRYQSTREKVRSFRKIIL